MHIREQMITLSDEQANELTELSKIETEDEQQFLDTLKKYPYVVQLVFLVWEMPKLSRSLQVLLWPTRKELLNKLASDPKLLTDEQKICLVSELRAQFRSWKRYDDWLYSLKNLFDGGVLLKTLGVF